MPALLVVQDARNGVVNWQAWSIYKGHTWAYTDSWQRHVYAHVLPPNMPNVTTYYTNTFRCQEGDSAMNPSSNHPGGVNIAFMDGSVRFIKNTVSLPAWWCSAPGPPARSSRPTPTEPELGSFHSMNTTAVPPIVRSLAAALTAAAVLAFASAGGCGSSEQFNQAVEYTPDTLAQELAFRYQRSPPRPESPKSVATPRAGSRGTSRRATTSSRRSRRRPRRRPKKPRP